MPLYFSRFMPLPHHVFVVTLKLLKVTHEHKISLSRLESEKSLSILPNGFPVTEFKVSGCTQPVYYSKIQKKSIWQFNAPFTPSLRDLRVLLGIMHLAIKLSHKNELDEGCEVFMTLSEIKAASAIGSNLDDIKSSISNLSQISLNTGDEWRFLIECEQLQQPFRLSQLALVLHPILVKSVHKFLKKNETANTTSYSIYYINDLCKLNKKKGSKSAQALYIYYSSTLGQGNRSYNHSIDTLCRKIYYIVDKLDGGDRRSLRQGIWRLSEVGWQVTMPSNALYLVKRPQRQSVQRAKTDKLMLTLKTHFKPSRGKAINNIEKNVYRTRYPIMRAET